MGDDPENMRIQKPLVSLLSINHFWICLLYHKNWIPKYVKFLDEGSESSTEFSDNPTSPADTPNDSLNSDRAEESLTLAHFRASSNDLQSISKNISPT